jgi:Flp pilus assembly protein CpaB
VRGNGVNDPTGGGTTLTLLQQVEVLAVDQRVETPADQKVDVTQMRSVTLLVTPEQATKLELGQTLGVLHLSLRNPLDTSVAENALVSMKDFRLPGAAAPDVPPQRTLPGEKEPPPAPPKPPPPPAPPPILSLRGSQGSWTRMP